jgi:hypothetical protein
MLMPVAKQNTGNGFSGVIGYVLVQKDVPEHLQPKILECNNVLESSGDDMAKQMRAIALDNDRVKKPVAHLQVSFHPEEKLSTDQAMLVIDSLLSDIGVKKEDHQYLVVEHFDKPHQHYHVVLNRVDFDGKVLKDNNINLRLNVACDKVEKVQRLRPTPGRTRVFDSEQEKGYRLVNVEQSKKVLKVKSPKVNTAKADLQVAVKNALANRSVQTVDQLKAELSKQGFSVELTKDGKGIGFGKPKTDQSSAYAFKGSAIGYKWNDVNKALETNKQQSQADEIKPLNAYKLVLRQSIDETVERVNVNVKMPVTVEKATKQEADEPIPLGLQVKLKKTQSEDEIIKLNLEKIKSDKQQWEDAKRLKPEPTQADLKEIDVVDAYNRVIKTVIDDFKDKVSKGDTSYDLVGTYKLTVDNWIGLKHDQLNDFMKEDLPLFKKAQEDLDNDYKRYQQALSKYETLQEQQPEKAGLFASGRTKADIARRNDQLKLDQNKAVKPEFKPVIRLDHSSFEKESTFSHRLTVWEITERLKEKGIIENLPKRDIAEQYAIAVKATIDAFKEEASKGNVRFDINEMFLKNMDKNIPDFEPHLQTLTNYYKQDLPKFQDAQVRLISDYENHKSKRPDDAFNPVVNLYPKHFEKSSTFISHEQERLKSIREDQGPDPEERRKGRRL